jgi:beta-glucosidase
LSFPKDFVWGAASAAYQIEGAAFEDGKGVSIWDKFVREPGKIWNGQTGDIACDHYHRYQEDVDLMRRIGLKGYRFSVCWPRILPAGTGQVNVKGLAFYDRLVDALLEAGIIPYITLFHWDYPYELYIRGGWLNPDSPDWFAEYTKAVVDKLSDRVSHWFTQNEPQCFVGLGYLEAQHAPGLAYDLSQFLQVGHHALLAHGKAVQTIRANAKTAPKIGYAPQGNAAIPISNTPQDIEAARSDTFAMTQQNSWNNTWWIDPVCLGHYPEDGLRLFGHHLPKVPESDFDIIRQPLDFIGLNVYFGKYVKAGANGPENIPLPPGHPITAFDWQVLPEVLYWTPRFFYERYHLPVIISENGMSNIDWVALDGKVHDPQRIDYLARYLRQLRRAADDGVKIAGYFHWSLTDNFEWAYGFKERFGLIYLDFKTQKRVLKDSALWYKEVIGTNGENLNER